MKIIMALSLLMLSMSAGAATVKWKVECRPGDGTLTKVSTYEFRCKRTNSSKTEYRQGTCSGGAKLEKRPYSGQSYSCFNARKSSTGKFSCARGFSMNSQANSPSKTCKRTVPASQTWVAPFLKRL